LKVTKEQTAQNKEAMVTAASRSYREKGIEGIGISELARSVGLTHGGFYGQFPGGKDQLAAEAVSKIFELNVKQWLTKESLEAIVLDYLSEQNLDDWGTGCPIPALGSDIARRGGPVSTSFTEGINGQLDALVRHIHLGTPSEKKDKAMQVLTSVAGALLIARAVDDQALSHRILQSVTKSLMALAARPEDVMQKA
jgi:TetR/AcrR family transcriptional repressor of nem operon